MSRFVFTRRRHFAMAALAAACIVAPLVPTAFRKAPAAHNSSYSVTVEHDGITSDCTVVAATASAALVLATKPGVC